MNTVMKLEAANNRDWQGFARVLEMLSFVEDIQSRSPEEVREFLNRSCEFPNDPGQTLTLEEVLFWAGVSCGMEFLRRTEDEPDRESDDKMLVFSSLFSQSLKKALVDIALGQVESQTEPPRQRNLEKWMRVMHR